MEKVLRSLIHEVFPYELRVELNLLQRRGDIGNKEKQEELLLLLRKYNIKDVVQLGAGTNRYAIRIRGYAIKISVDVDGTIDNAKEFMLSKLLYPHVIRVHEISSNYNLLVTEYIQPYSSFYEMKEDEDKIQKILSDWSSMFLIGDVGISSKNYANWGRRIGTEDPVCLDFAYAYGVSSKLFTCDYCGIGALEPTRDFTHLCCNNPACGKKYDFTDIRLKISNDMHKQEIGDLSERGYLLSQSFTTTQLDAKRSSYLNVINKKKEKKGEKKIDIIPEIDNNFMMPYDL